MAVKQGGLSLTAALRVLFFSHLIGFTALVAFALVRHDAVPQVAAILWALGAGLIAGLSIVCFFFALAQAPMGAAAALSGLLAAAIPAALTLVLDGSPGKLKLFGFLLAGVAIWYIASSPSPSPSPSAKAVPETAPPAVPVQRNHATQHQSALSSGRTTPSAPAFATASAATSTTSPAKTLLLAVLAGVGFGLYFIALKMAGSSGVVWPMVVSRVGSLSACGLMALALALRGSASSKSGRSTGERSRRVTSAISGPRSASLLKPRSAPLLEPRSASLLKPRSASLSEQPVPVTPPPQAGRSFAGWVILAAILGTGGDLTFLAATRVGRLDIASVLASMYPASTILLAAWLLNERLSRRQTFGMVVALAAVILITL